MTQKELLYYEDAIGHECGVIAYCMDILNALEDKNLISFIEDEIKKHKKIKEKLIKILEVKSND